MTKLSFAAPFLAVLSACSTTYPPSEVAQTCSIHMARSPGPGGEGVVRKVLTQQAAMALLDVTQAQIGAPIGGAYINNLRVVLTKPDGESATVLVPYGMTVSTGDRLAFQGSYRSPGLPCSYVPNLATQKF